MLKIQILHFKWSIALCTYYLNKHSLAIIDMQHYQEDTGCGVDSEGSDESYIDMQEYEYISSEKKQKRSQKKQTLPPKPPKKPAYKNKEKTAPGVISLHASLPRKKFSAFHQNTNASGPRYDIDMAYDQPRNTVYKMKTLKPAVSHEYEQIPEVPIHPVAQTNSFDLLSEKYIVSSDEMMLGEFVNKYKNDFPVQIRVSKGYYGTTDKWCISEGDYFTIHFVKQTKVVGAVDSTFGNYSIPINSSAQFGVVPTSSREAAGGNNFYTVGNLLAQQTLPLAIKATQTWNESKAEKSVSNGEIFIIQGSKGRIKRTLKCVNAINGKQKTLSSKCAGSFTTNPYEIRLYLPEVIKNFSLPNTFAMFINSQSTSSVQYVKLTHCSIETSLIATQLDSLESSPLTEIPIDLDIGIELVRPKFKAEEEARIYELTDHLFSTFDHKALQTIPSNIASLQADPVKAEALLTCHRGHERVGVEIQQPPRYNIRQSHPSQATQSGAQKQYSETGSATELKLQKIESMLTSVMQQVEGKISLFSYYQCRSL